ncbi:MAG: AAA family ATPase [Calditrichaceae bacterium]|nr:AAA family ATPase [Calditrichaceae bacterium]MBN2709913.1 AAA family ATPase [Calditrichaceae bacterium]RQV92666.1 MAG: ATP-binding protein [Calditrichota bacterium]
MLKQCIVPVKKLRKQINDNLIPADTTADIPSLTTVIGQDRAVDSISFALEIVDSGYNIFVTGRYGTGRTTIVTDLLNKVSKKMDVPDDWAYVFNFKNPDAPSALHFAPGKASKFKQRYERQISTLSIDLKTAFESKNYTEQKNSIIEQAQLQKQKIFSNLEKEALDSGVQIKTSNLGFITLPMKNGEPMSAEAFQTLSSAERSVINNNIEEVQKKIQETARVVHNIDRTMENTLDELNQSVARYVVNTHFTPMIESYKNQPDVKQYLEDAAEDIIKNVEFFTGTEEADQQQLPYKLDKYQVNVQIDNSGLKGAPVVYETNPTYNNLFGRIEKKAYQGYVYADYTMIKPGSLLHANGGYLIIDADQLLKHPYSYEALKRSLRSRNIYIEDIQEFYGFTTAAALKPACIPLHVKVIMIGRPQIYQLLHNYDEEFRKIFKVRADFDVEVKESKSTINKYIQFISRVVNEENLLHLDRSAIIAVIEHGYRLADHQKKMSIQFGEIVKIIRESSFWAKKHNHKIVRAKDVEYAIQSKIYRHNLVEEKVHETIMDKSIKVDVKGSVVGQVNGLAVYDLGDYSFGRPSRITVNTFIGSRGIINIEREAKMSGKIHDKGVLVLTGYFYQKFGESMPLSFSASITFEQNYGTIDGDSASSTELYALLSSLSQVPIDQGIAVTGSVNQKGEVQAIGGVNEKIEGFFKVCKARRLNGKQGVIIPASNVENLMLNDEVVTAVKNGKFHIWAVNKIEEGLQILTGQNCGQIHKDGAYTKNSIFEKVRLKLIEFAKISHQFQKSLGKPDEKNDETTDEKD